jgi:hypothetical protein
LELAARLSVVQVARPVEQAALRTQPRTAQAEAELASAAQAAPVARQLAVVVSFLEPAARQLAGAVLLEPAAR